MRERPARNVFVVCSVDNVYVFSKREDLVRFVSVMIDAQGFKEQMTSDIALLKSWRREMGDMIFELDSDDDDPERLLIGCREIE